MEDKLYKHAYNMGSKGLPDVSIRETLRQLGWEPQNHIDRAFELYAYAGDLAGSLSHASTIGNLFEDEDDDGDDKDWLITDPRGYWGLFDLLLKEMPPSILELNKTVTSVKKL